MPETSFGQTTLQRAALTRQLHDFAKGAQAGVSGASFFTKQDLIDHGVNDLGYPTVVVKAVIRELTIQGFVRFSKEKTT